MPLHLAQILPPEASTAKAARAAPIRARFAPQDQSRARPLDGAKRGTTVQVRP